MTSVSFYSEIVLFCHFHVESSQVYCSVKNVFSENDKCNQVNTYSHRKPGLY